MAPAQPTAGDQLADELDVALALPAADLLGMDVAEVIRKRIGSRVPALVSQLTQDRDDRLSADTAGDLMGAIWPHGVADLAWWRTPLGRACARALAAEDSEAVTYSTAAAMLGVVRGTVSVLVARGKLDRHPDGGLTRTSVLLRVADGREAGS